MNKKFTNSKCRNEWCADEGWKDGCEACMCFNQGNTYWCDGTRGDYYDSYFKEHNKSPYGITDVHSRKW